MLIFGEMCQHFNYISRLQARVFFDNSAFKWIVNVMSGKETTPVPSAYRRKVVAEKTDFNQNVECSVWRLIFKSHNHIHVYFARNLQIETLEDLNYKFLITPHKSETLEDLEPQSTPHKIATSPQCPCRLQSLCLRSGGNRLPRFLVSKTGTLSSPRQRWFETSFRWF